MAAPIHDQVIAEMEARLQTVPGHTVLRQPLRPSNVDEMPVFELNDDGGEQLQVGQGFTLSEQWDHIYTVTVRTADKDKGEALGESVTLCREAIVPPPPSKDTTLGDLVEVVTCTLLGPVVDDAEEGRVRSRARDVRFLVKYWTGENDPRTLAPP